MNYKDLGHRIRTARRQKKMTQEFLAEKVGISASFLGHIERGTRVASLETLVALCNALSVSPNHLLAASLDSSSYAMPTGLSTEDRARLTHFLRMAEDTVLNWDED